MKRSKQLLYSPYKCVVVLLSDRVLPRHITCVKRPHLKWPTTRNQNSVVNYMYTAQMLIT